ncbi:hypothetical protein [Qipengyuania sp. ASV99]|uniref:hypothetical protein n=1 Tax=Qipengyuania sp. ASV99 TaxID=3399681 RepID=UPI003A4C7DA1
MEELSMDRSETTCVEAILRDELARGNRALSGVAPVISHLLENSGHALVSDAIVARLRGMLSDVARQLLGAGLAPHLRGQVNEDAADQLSAALAGNSSVLNHLYALAMEGHLTERLEQRSSLDPVLSPLLQELIASDRPNVAEIAMNALAAQSRFMQGQRRMNLPVGELPADLFLQALECFRKAPLNLNPAQVSSGVSALKARYDEGVGRLGLFARLIGSMRGGAVVALELNHSGLALFVSAMAALTRQPRDLAILACHQRQAARLALSLRAAGLDARAIERQFVLIEPDEMLPTGIADLRAERAQELLAASDVSPSFHYDAA